MQPEAEVSWSVAVFPLPDAVLFPGQRMPLHIFEPRYREMVRDLLDGTLTFVVIARTRSAEEDFEPVATAGRIVAHEALPDGRFHVLVEGVHRVSAHEISSDKNYRMVRCERLPEPLGEAACLTELDGLSLRAVLDALISALQKLNPRVRYTPTDAAPARLAWNIAANLVPDPNDRQKILESNSAAERVALTTEALAEVLSRLSSHSPGEPQGAN